MEQRTLSGGSTVHDFRHSLNLSLLPKYRTRFRCVYERRWPEDYPTFAWTDNDPAKQARGIDVEFTNFAGRVFGIDEKIRPLNPKYTLERCDFLCEVLSDEDRNSPGWVIDSTKQTDYVAYAIERVSRCWILPYPVLRRVATRMVPEWTARYGTCVALNDGWKTLSVPVPWRVLCDALKCREADVRHDW